MKIQSSLLILAAMATSATAANKRKRVFKIYSREEIQAAEQVTRSLQKEQGGGKDKDKDKDKTEAIVTAMSMETAMSMPVPVVPAMCAFCADGVADLTLDLGVQGQTCGSVLAAASRLNADDANCALAKQAEFLCCPYVPPTTTTTAATTAMAMSMPVAEMSMPAATMSMPTTTVGETGDAPVYETPVYEEDVVEAEKELPPTEEA